MNKIVVVELLGEGIDENILGLIPNILDLMVENIQKYLLISTVFVQILNIYVEVYIFINKGIYFECQCVSAS